MSPDVEKNGYTAAKSSLCKRVDQSKHPCIIYVRVVLGNISVRFNGICTLFRGDHVSILVLYAFFCTQSAAASVLFD